jgi:hypothetical protein
MSESDAEKNAEKKGFKVVDRRRFTEDGTERTGPDVAPPEPRKEPAAAAAPGPKPEPPKAAEKPGEKKPDGKKPTPAEEAPGGLNFSIFVQSLAQQALMQLGLIPWPHGQRELHLDQARDTIDILQMLKVKTKGNLSTEETQLLDTAIYELKMSWVEVQQAIARSKGAGGGMPRPPGR